MERLTPIGEDTKESLEPPQALVFKEQKSRLNLKHHIVRAERAPNLSITSWRAPDQNFLFQSNRPVEPKPLYMEGNKVYMNRVHHVHVLFLCSLSAMFNEKIQVFALSFLWGRTVDDVGGGR